MSEKRDRTRRKELSQHFLRSRALAASLVAGTSIATDDLVVEVGPGRGMLTQELARRCGRIVAVEVDAELVRDLRAMFYGDPHVVVEHEDFLRFDLPRTPYKVFGNIPFRQTAAIVRRLADAPPPPTDTYLVVQLEAAERFAGRPYAGETLGSLLLKPWWHIEIARRLRRTDFEPPPSVDAVLLWLSRRARPLVGISEARLYGQFVSSSFGRRGNSLRRCLRPRFTARQLGRLAQDLRFDPAGPPSALAFDQWLGLFRYFALERGQSMRD